MSFVTQLPPWQNKFTQSKQQSKLFDVTLNNPHF